MPRFSERRGERRQDDDSYDEERGWRRREDGPWSPYNGGKRSFEHSPARDERRFDSRGRDYWRENEDESPREWYEGGDFSRDRERDDFSQGRELTRRRWDDRRMRPADDWSYREHLHDPITEGEPRWGNEMGLRSDQPSGRSIPRGPDWQSEPHPSEAWIAREDRYRDRRDDDRMREASGERYPASRRWQDERGRGLRDERGREPRDWRGRTAREDFGQGREQRGYGRDERGGEQRGYGRDERGGEQRGYGREMRGSEQRDMRDREQRGYGREVRDREQRDMHDREQRGFGRDMRGGDSGDMRGGDSGDMRARGREYGSDTGARRDFGRERDMRGPRDYEARERELRDLRAREQREYHEMRDERELRRDTRDRRGYADDPGRDLGSFEGDHGRWTRREFDVDNRDVRADDSHELRRDRGEPWRGSETRGSDEYGRGLEQRSPEDRFRPENREWASRISGGDRSRRP